MSVASFLKSSHPTAFSFEVLPPVRGKSIDNIFSNIDRLMAFNPAYINITTHRTEVVYQQIENGMFRCFSEIKRPGTVAIAAALKGRYGIPTVPHIICGGYSRQEIEDELIDLSYLGINDILVLRGDRQKGENKFTAATDGHSHADGLCGQVNDFNIGKMTDGTETEPLAAPFTYGVAGYPEKHEEAMNPETDMAHLRQKVEMGAEYIVTQMFFDNQKYFEFVDRCRKAGITVPIIPGIKPLTTLTQATLLPKTFHIDMPEDLAKEMARCKSNDDVKALGVEWGTAQAKELKAANVPSIHFYTINATASVERIARNVY
ncbi:MAG: methylenetetrahydrofolate reductase [Prevotella sp.]|nr:methylenetetrahydrofolate reductase [Prevotella sp.]MBO5156515.1 methylenetetrahydrofolate reductase [Prevotella sp.]